MDLAMVLKLQLTTEAERKNHNCKHIYQIRRISALLHVKKKIEVNKSENPVCSWKTIT